MTVIPLRTTTTVTGHTRRLPRDPAFIAMTEKLYAEVNDHMTELLCNALSLAFADDEEFAVRTKEAW